MTEVVGPDKQARIDGQKLIDLAPDHWPAHRFLAACTAAGDIVMEKSAKVGVEHFRRLLE